MRVALLFLSLVLAGCSSLPNRDVSSWHVSRAQTTYVLPANADEDDALAAFDGPSLYLVALRVTDGTCYIRMVDGLPNGQICQFGELVRYSPDAPLAIGIEPVPTLVLGLFDSLAEAESELPTQTPGS